MNPPVVGPGGLDWVDCGSDQNTLQVAIFGLRARIIMLRAAAATAWRTACENDPVVFDRQNCLAILAEVDAGLVGLETSITAADVQLRAAGAITTAAVQDANALGVGDPNVPPLPLAPRLHFVAAALQVDHAMLLAWTTYNDMLIAVMYLADRAASSPILLPLAPPALDLLAGMIVAVLSGPFRDLRDCVVHTTATIATTAFVDWLIGGAPGPPINPILNFGGGGTTSSGPLRNVHCAWDYEPPEDVSIAALPTAQPDGTLDGRLYKSFSVGYSVPDGMTFGTDVVSPVLPIVIVAAGTDVVAIDDQADTIPTVTYNAVEDRVEIDGYGLNQHWAQADETPRSTCTRAGDDHILEAGETQVCILRLDVTGSPDEIAAGDVAINALHTVLSSGGNLHGTPEGAYFNVRYRVRAPKEGPTDPCWIWSHDRYVLDIANPTCGPTPPPPAP